MKNNYTGLSQTTTRASGGVLTIGSIEKMIKYEKSKKAAKEYSKRQKAEFELKQSIFHQMTCGDGAGKPITSHSINCIFGLYKEDETI
jgi:hypothetical protein